MKKRALSLLAAALVLSSVPAVSAMPASAEKDSGLKIVVTIFPEYDWIREIMGGLVSENELILLLDDTVDMHSYQPTAIDMMNISTADLFVYVGGNSDKWVKDSIREVMNQDQVTVNLLEALGDAVKTEELAEGMEHDHEDDDHEDGSHADIEEDHDHGDGSHEDEAEDADPEEKAENRDPGDEADEHVWLSLRNAAALVSVLTDTLAELDPDHADDYRNNAAAYTEKLEALDQEYAETVKEAAADTLLFADRFPFRYLTDDYGLNYYAAFSGCSAETEASFETILFLAQKMNELELKHVMTIESSDGKLAQTIIRSTKDADQDVLVLNSLQSVTSDEIQDGVSYYGIMQENLEVLKEALN